MKKNRCAVLAAIFGIFSFSVWGQGVGSWKSYKAYHNAVQVVETPQAVYAVYQSSYPDSYRNSSNSVIEQNGSLLSYSFNDKRLQTYSLEDGLNDASIRFLNYSPEANALLLVYESNNVDIFLGKHNVYNLPNLMKTAINSVDIRGKLAYLSISSGISIIDLERKEIKSTYNLGANTMATCEWNGYIWAATTDGVYKASLNLHSSKLSDKANWEKISFPEINDRAITKMTIFQDHLIVDCNTGIWSYSKAGNVRQFTANSCKQLIVCNNRLFTIYYGNSLVMYPSVDSGFRVKTLDYMIEGISASNQIQDGYWIATGKDGLVQAKIIVEEDMAETIISNLQLNSPVRNLSFNIKFAENRLLVTGGNRAANRNNILGTFMIYENGKWLNLDKNIVAQGLPGLPDLACRDLMSAAVDPLDPHHYFVSSWGEGVYEFRDTTFLNLHSYNNSSLKTIFENNPNFIRTDGLAFDRNNNLYILNVKNGLNVLTQNGKWNEYQNDELAGSQINHLIVTKDNKKWLNVFRTGGNDMKPTSIYVFDDNNTIDNIQDDTWYRGRLFTDQQGRKVEETTYLCLAEDLTGTVWAGTDNGLIYFTSAEQLSRNECNRIVGTDEYGKGFYPLEGQKITAIAIDGANRKWIGTQGSGVFFVDQSGDLRVDQFNRSNSPILSDNINSIAINNHTGEVFFATDRGICSYMGEAIDGLPDYSQARAYPNPVDPARYNRVAITGLMQNSVVKITDLAGNRIKEAQSYGGQYVWDCSGTDGELVKAGIYLVFATLPDGSLGVVTKIMVLR